MQYLDFLVNSLESAVNQEYLSALEQIDNIFPDIDYRLFK